MSRQQKIDEVLAAIRRLWLLAPQLRLGQIVASTIGPDAAAPAVFQLSDAMLLERLSEFEAITRRQQPRTEMADSSGNPFAKWPENLAALRVRFPEQLPSIDDADYYWPDGWNHLVWAVCERNNTLGTARWSCIKEKLGQLRIINQAPWEHGPAADEIEEFKEDVWRRSKHTCARCACEIPIDMPQPQRINAWLIALCLRCLPAVEAWHSNRLARVWIDLLERKRD